jgi:hypothetical protein
VSVVERRRSRRGLLLATALALIVAWLTTNSPVPIYDGIGAPDEPYRYVSPPPGDKVRTQPPTSAVADLVSRGTARVVEMSTAEQGPQAQAFLAGQDLTVAPAAGTTAAASSVTVTLTPLAPESGPSGPRIDGNIYRLSWDAGTSIAHFRNRGSDQILLRAVKAPPPKATFLFRRSAAESWRRLPTSRVGADIYLTLVQGEGEYALTLDAPGASTHGSAAATIPHQRTGGVNGRLILAAGLVLVMLGVIVTVRLLRARAAE